MKKVILLVSSLVMALIFTGASQTTYFSVGSLNHGTVTLNYVASEVDTLKYKREAGISALSFGLSYSDSINITNIVVVKRVNDQSVAAVSADTLTSGDSSATAGAFLSAITLAPIADEYWIIVKFSADHGAIDQSTDDNTATAEIIKQYSR